MSSNCPYFLLQLAFLECFMSITSSLDVFLPLISLSFFNSHPSNRVSCSSTYELKIKSVFVFECARASMVVRGRAFLRFRFKFFQIFLRVGGEIRSCALPKECTESYTLPQDHGGLAKTLKVCISNGLVLKWSVYVLCTRPTI